MTTRWATRLVAPELLGLKRGEGKREEGKREEREREEETLTKKIRKKKRET